MRRREFLGVLGGAAAAWPLAVYAQQVERMRRVGVLLADVPDDAQVQSRITAFRQGLEAFGWIIGQNIIIDYRWAGSVTVEKLRAYAAELIELRPDVILTYNSTALVAGRQLTSTIPIIFVLGGDPVAGGLVASLAHPGMNITGFPSFVEYDTGAKMLELLKEVAPQVNRVIVLQQSADPMFSGMLSTIEKAAVSLGVKVLRGAVTDASEMQQAIEDFAQAQIGGNGIIALSSQSTTVHRQLIFALAAKYRLPAVYPYRFFVANGGLLAYGPDDRDIFRRSASYVDRILKGEKPGDLPVQAPTKFELVINLKTAKALGLTIPPTLLARTDEVIE